MTVKKLLVSTRETLISIQQMIVLLLGVTYVYPLVIGVISRIAFMLQKKAPLVTNAQGEVVGFGPLAQTHAEAGYFRPRYAAAGSGYDLTQSTGPDPQISLLNAEMQASCIAEDRGVSIETVKSLIKENTSDLGLGFLGEQTVNVLTLNLALDKTAPMQK